MKKLFAVLMIAGLFGFASCGSSEPKTEEGTAVDTAAVAPTTEAAPTTEPAPADTAAAMPADTAAH